MNIVLFDPAELAQPLASEDPRTRHVLEVLGCGPGDSFDAGLLNGPRGKARVESVEQGGLVLSFAWGEPPPPADPVTLIVGLCRPQTMRRVLREAASLGVAHMRFARTGRGEATYADSSLWTTGEFERHVRTGVEQAFTTQIPRVDHGMDLTEALDVDADVRLALDNYEGTAPLHRVSLSAGVGVAVAVGAERGWTPQERDALRDTGYQLVGLGPRVLRTEVAVIAALSLVKAATGSWDAGPTPDSRQE